MRPAAVPLSLALLAVVAAPALAGSSPVLIRQGSANNVASVILEHSSVLSIHHDRSVTSGDTTVDEVVDIGPDLVPVVISQNGTVNRATTFQQGTAPTLDLRQNGTRNTSTAIQREIP